MSREAGQGRARRAMIQQAQRRRGLPQSEKQWMANVTQVARLYGFVVYHTHDSRRSEPGFPDLIMIKGRYMIVVELKTDTGKVTHAQQAWLDAFAGVREVRACVWRPGGANTIYQQMSAFSMDADRESE